MTGRGVGGSYRPCVPSISQHLEPRAEPTDGRDLLSPVIMNYSLRLAVCLAGVESSTFKRWSVGGPDSPSALDSTGLHYCKSLQQTE